MPRVRALVGQEKSFPLAKSRRSSPAMALSWPGLPSLFLGTAQRSHR